MEKRFLDLEESKLFLAELIEEKKYDLQVDLKKNAITAWNKDHSKAFDFRLPEVFPLLKDGELLEIYLNRIPEIPKPYLMILIQAGAGALAFFENNEITKHKVIKKYMVRKKQGRAEITQMRKKARHSAGSRLRIANSLAFFEEINDKIKEWKIIDSSHRILYNCPIRLWNHVFLTKTKPPFDKKDKRITKIPMDVRVPGFEELSRVQSFVNRGIVQYPELKK